MRGGFAGGGVSLGGYLRFARGEGDNACETHSNSSKNGGDANDASSLTFTSGPAAAEAEATTAAIKTSKAKRNNIVGGSKQNQSVISQNSSCRPGSCTRPCFRSSQLRIRNSFGRRGYPVPALIPISPGIRPMFVAYLAGRVEWSN